MTRWQRFSAAIPLQLLFLHGLNARAAEIPAEAAEQFRHCASMTSPDVRLACFDELAAGYGIRVAGTQNDGVLDGLPGGSRVARRWDLEDVTQRGRFALMVHRPNYFLAGTYNFVPNQTPFDAGELRVRNEEIKLQLSFKVKLAESLIGDNGDLWATYTQQAYWLAYAKSSPFRDTSYEPSLLFTWRTNYDLLGWRGRVLGLELDHQSNGRSDFAELSRSWNRVIAHAVFERGDVVAEARAWWRIPEPAVSDNNPDIVRYLGDGDLTLSWEHGRHTLSAQLRSTFDAGSHRAAAELGWSFPLPNTDNLKGYVQYFYGYGESLIDYNVRTNRIGLGVALSDWY